MKSILQIIICFVIPVFAGSATVKIDSYPLKQQRITLRFQHTIGNETLALEMPFKNILGENMVVEKFKYYLSHFAIEDYTGKIIKLPVQYYLIDESDSLSKSISLMLPVFPIKSFRFLLGVDSIKNVSGAQTGALDPANGMFWTWNTGYIMAKLEGSSEASTAQAHRFIYHIGGYKKTQNAARNIVLPISQNQKIFSNIIISADINQWFKSNATLSIAETPICQTPGNLALKIADNYQTMFSIKAMH